MHEHTGGYRYVLLSVFLATLVAAILFLFSYAHHVYADGTTYYVDCSAASDGNGSQASPWNSLNDVNTFNAPDGFSPGDAILFAAGTTCDGQLHPLGSGSSSAPITIDMYNSGARPHIDGQGNVTDTVYLYNQQYWNIQDLEVSNDGSANAQRTGVRVVNNTGGTLNHIHIENLSVHNIKGYVNGYYSQNGGISVEADSNTVNTLWNDVLIQGNTITTVDRIGIFVGPNQDNATVGRSSNVVIQNNTISDSGGDDILVYVTTGALIQYNTGSNGGSRSNADCQSSSYCNQASAGMWAALSDHATFQYNVEAYNQNSSDGEGFDSDFSCHSCVFQYNYSHDNAGGFILLVTQDNQDTVIRDNISQNDAKTRHGVISFVESSNSPLTDLQIYNNTFYIPSGSSANVVNSYFGSLSQTFSFTNNIVDLQGSGGYTSDSNATYDHNLFYGNHPSSEPSDAHEVSGDPLFADADSGGLTLDSVTGYQLQTNSPALNAGTVIANNGGQDYFGNSVSSTAAPNIGAYNGAGVAGSTGAIGSNLGFESGSLAPWYVSSGSPSVVNSDAHSGSYALQTGVSYSGANQDITGLSSNTTYVLTAWAENENSGDTVYIGVKNFGGTETSTGISTTSYSQGTVTFTTGANTTGATIYCYKNAGAGESYCDDFSVTPQLGSNLGFESGSLAPWYVSNGTPSVVNSNAHSGSYALQSGVSYSGANQDITGLSSNTTYVLSGWAENADSGDTVYIGVKNFGGTETSTGISTTSYSQGTVTFTTGANSTGATIYCYKNAGAGESYCDDFSVTPQ